VCYTGNAQQNFRWRSRNGQHPDHSTLARFFKANRQAMRQLFVQTVHTLVHVGLVGFALHAVGGTRVSAVSRDKALSREELVALEERAARAIAQLERSVEAEEESASADPEGCTMPEARKDPEELQARVEQALADRAGQADDAAARCRRRADPCGHARAYGPLAIPAPWPGERAGGVASALCCLQSASDLASVEMEGGAQSGDGNVGPRGARVEAREKALPAAQKVAGRSPGLHGSRSALKQ